VPSATAERVLAILADVLETEAPRRDPELRLYDVHLLDSLRTVELIVALEESFGFEISPAQLDRSEWATPRLIVDYVARRVER
jgi:D-alanine--poly(phosphoribitol) ligase subunit 2